jgi:hypothetical protein
MFRTDPSIIRRIKRFNHTSSLWHLSLGRCLSCVAVNVGSNTNGRPRQTTTEGTVPEAACAIKAFDSPDDGPIGPKHVETDKKPRL